MLGAVLVGCVWGFFLILSHKEKHHPKTFVSAQILLQTCFPKENILHPLTLHEKVGNFVMLFILQICFALFDAIYESHCNFALTAETMFSSERQGKPQRRKLPPSNFWNMAMNPISYSVSPLYKEFRYL